MQALADEDDAIAAMMIGDELRGIGYSHHARHCVPDAPVVAKSFAVSQLVAAVAVARPARARH